MKGQLSFDFYIGLIVFVTFVAYLIFEVMKITPTYLDKMREQRLYAEAYQISELLINDQGEPINWNVVGGTKRLGLSDSSRNVTNYISLSKAAAFNNICNSDYTTTKALLGIPDNYQFSVYLVSKVDSTVPISCKSPQAIGRVRIVNMTRTVGFSSGYGELILLLW